MSQGKYSPSLTREHIRRSYNETYIYNADGKIPEILSPNDPSYDERVHFANYDSEGYDRYGYSAFLDDGTFVGMCDGIDRFGYTELDYLEMDVHTFMNYFV